MRPQLTILSVLLLSALNNAKSRSKKFKLISIKPDAWNKLKELKEARSDDLCRNACVKAEDECQAYFFNEVTDICEFGDFSGSPNPVLWHPDHGMRIRVEDGFQPDTKPRLALFGGIQKVDWDFDFDTMTSTATPWFPAWDGETAGDEAHSCGGLLEGGFFMCVSQTDANHCKHLKLGATHWESRPGY